LTFQPTTDTLRLDGIAVAHHLLNDLGIQDLIIHGESIGGVAASGTGRFLSHEPSSRSKLSLLICDRTFCNLEAVAQRLVGGWSGYAIRALAPLWNSDVTSDFISATCAKIVANDSADMIISDAASLKSGVALWKEVQRGVATARGIGWIRETPLQYRMADWENVCVNDSKYVAGAGLFRAKAPVWPSDKHVSLEEAFHFAACCKRIGKLAKPSRHRQRMSDEGAGVECDDAVGPFTQENILQEIWKSIACCDGLTGVPLGVAVKHGFDTTVSWLCTCLVYGGQTIARLAEERRKRQGGGVEDAKTRLMVDESDFDARPPGYQQQEIDGKIHPIPIPEVVSRIVFFLEQGDPSLAGCKFLFEFCIRLILFLNQSYLQCPTSLRMFLACCSTSKLACLLRRRLKLP
jgi:hypothetical protein